MLDFGLPELILIMIVLILVIGPQQIPEIMYNLGRIMRRVNYMRFALSRQFEDFMHDMDTEKRSGQDTDSLSMLPREGQTAYQSSPEEEEDEDYMPPEVIPKDESDDRKK